MKRKTIFDEYIEYQRLYEEKYGPQTIVFMEVGSFFEIYGIQSDEDSVQRIQRIGSLLNIIVTKKNKKKVKTTKQNPLMAGFPNHSIHKFIQLLLSHQYTIILVEQVTPAPNPERDVTHIYSPSTYIESTNNSAQQYLMALYVEEVVHYKTHEKQLCIAISFLDCSTGENHIYESSSSSVSQKLSMEDAYRIIHGFQPREISCWIQAEEERQSLVTELVMTQLELGLFSHHVYYTFPSHMLSVPYQREFFEKIFDSYELGMLSIFEFLEIDSYYYGKLCYVLLLQFAYEHDETLLLNIQKPQLMETHHTLVLVNNAVHQLNLIPKQSSSVIKSRELSLAEIITYTHTPMGKRKVMNRLLQPITCKQTLRARYQIIEEFRKPVEESLLTWYEDQYPMDEQTYSSVAELCRSQLANSSHDVERIHRKIHRYQLEPREIALLILNYDVYDRVWSILQHIPELSSLELDSTHKQKYNEFREELIKTYDSDRLLTYSSSLPNLDDPDTLQSFLRTGIVPEIDENSLKIQHYSALLHKISAVFSNLIEKGSSYVRIERNDSYGYHFTTTTKRASVLKKKLVKFIQSKRHPITIEGNTISLEGIQYKTSSQKCRIVCPSISDLSYSLVDTYMKNSKLAKDYFTTQLQHYSSQYGSLFQAIIESVATIDCMVSGAICSLRHHYGKPTVSEEDKDASYIRATKVRHPIIEHIQQDIEYVPNDIHIGEDMTGMVVYGVNASGKSSYMKSIGVNLVLAQAGFWVAADTFEFEPYEYIFTRIGNLDNLYKQQSSFAVEMSELRNILRRANSKSLLLADELCCGTESTSALSIVSSTILQLSSMSASFLLATHLHDLQSISQVTSLKTVRSFHLEVVYDEERKCLVYHRTLQPGSGNAIYGLEVCRAMDMTPEFIQCAHNIRKELLEIPKYVVNPKQSPYNGKVYVDVCKICGKQGVDTHHIQFQESADEQGHIGASHKNQTSNLVVLCQACHDKVHHGKLVISGYIQTTEGKQLEHHEMSEKEFQQTKKRRLKYSEEQIRLIESFQKKSLTCKQVKSWLYSKHQLSISESTIRKIWRGTYH
tara:strand:+ start:364 stop:3570 length:3207 start_codon:yes stop_codon:yes gene_type:complete